MLPNQTLSCLTKRTLLVWCLIIFTKPLIFAEGTRELLTVSTDRAYFAVSNKIEGTTNSSFTDDENRRVHFHIASASGEAVKLAFGNVQGDAPSMFFRILDPDSNVVFGPMAVPTSSGTGFIDNFTQSEAGPNGVIQSGAASATTGSYDAIDFTPSTTGDFYIQFSINSSFTTAPTGSAYVFGFWDFTVYNTVTNDVLPGRVWAKTWSIWNLDLTFSQRMKSTFFSYSDDSIVTSIDFLDIRPNGFDIAMNMTGVSSASSVAVNRRSVEGSNSINPLYKLFLNNPDDAIYPDGVIGELSSSTVIKGCAVNDFCVVVDVTKAGLVDVVIDVNGLPGYQSGTTDILLEDQTVVSGENCIAWDGRDGLGVDLSAGTVVNILVDYRYGITHLPLYDIEKNPGGFHIDLIRPLAPSPLLFWDDVNISDGYDTDTTNGLNAVMVAQAKTNLGGITTTSSSGGHLWESPGDEDFGDINTINTWWYISESFTSLSYIIPEITTVEAGAAIAICMDTTNVVSLDGTRVETSSSVWVTDGSGTFATSDTILDGTYIPSTTDLSAGNVKLYLYAVDTTVCQTIFDSLVITFSSGSCFDDADNDGIADNIDIDDDNDGIPDVNELDGTTDPNADNDSDGNVNYLDTDFPGYVDANGDFLNDNFDKDLDGVPNHLDLDSDGDGILDLIEANHGQTDSDSDGRLDTGVGTNGLVDVLETVADNGTINYTILNTDADSNPNYLDIDADADGIVDVVEAQTTAAYIAPSGNDTDNDGLDDAHDGNNGGTYLTPVDSELQADETTPNPDGTADYLDSDSDNDGVPDTIEGHDANQNGVADTSPSGTDTDGDGLDDNYDTVTLTSSSNTNAAGSNSPLQDTDGLQEPDWRDVNDDNDAFLTINEDNNSNNVWSDDFNQGGGVFPDYLYSGDNDGDGIADATDPDDDNDGILDTDEGGGIDPSADDDNDNIPNYADNDIAGFVDSNGDGVNDNFDQDLDGIPNHYDLDSDNDGIADVVEAGGSDPDGDGIIGTGTPTDTDSDGIPDLADPTCNSTPATCASGTTNSTLGTPDTDSDGIPDALDLDSDNDGIADVIEAGGTDSDGDGKLDNYTDSDGDGLSGVVDSSTGGTALSNPDTDGDGLVNAKDLDADNDGIQDVLEAGGIDADGDGILDGIEDDDKDGIPNVADVDVIGGGDTDGDGISDTADVDQTAGTDTNGDGIDDAFDPDIDGDGWSNVTDSDNSGTVLPTSDQDGDGRANYIDIDSDDDGIVDLVEGGGTDANNDGVVDTATDTDGDGFADLHDTDNGGTNQAIADRDGDSLANYLDIDSDNDGIVDNVEGQPTTGYVAPSGTDTDGDGWDDSYDSSNGGTAFSPEDTDGNANDSGTGNAIADYLDYDSDDDGVLDLVEGHDNNSNGFPDWDTDNDYPASGGTNIAPSTTAFTEETGATTDTDGDGLLDIFDNVSGVSTTGNEVGSNSPLQDTNSDNEKDWRDLDDDGDGKNTSTEDDNSDSDFSNDNTEGCAVPDYLCSSDEDSDGIVNSIDIDDDNDGIPDMNESPTLTIAVDPNLDDDGDGTDNWLDPDTHGWVDATGNGTHDSFDTDDDGTLDVTVETDITAVALADADYDGDGISNYADTDMKGSYDLNLDGIGDPFDLDSDGVPDFYDLDSDNDGIADIQEAGHAGTDANGDGRIETAVGTNGLADALETTADNDTINYTINDFDGDGYDDYEDYDADNDGISDLIEAGGTDANYDGNPDSFTDADGDGLIDARDVTNGGALYTSAQLDKDSDGDQNHIDLDADNDGIQDVVEAGLDDTDGDGIVDGSTTDLDANGWFDSVELNTGSPAVVPDTDNDGLKNFLDLDADGDGIVDYIESGLSTTDGGTDGLSDNAATDTNNNGWNDTDEGTLSTAYTNTDGDAAIADLYDFIDIDADDDGIVDNIEGQSTANYVAPTGTDTDADGIDDAYDVDCAPCGTVTGAPVVPEDTDGDANDYGTGVAVPDYIDGDSDNDGVVDIIEGHDRDFDGIPDWDTDNDYPAAIPTEAAFVITQFTEETGATADADSDGLLDIYDNISGKTTAGNVTGSNAPTQNTDGIDDKDWRDTDDDNDARLSSAEDRGDGTGVAGSETPGGSADGNWANDFTQTTNAGTTPDYLFNDDIDTDGDGVADITDLDSDNDGILDTDEDGGTGTDPSADADSDGIPNYRDPDLAGFTDTNSDGTDDRFDNDSDGVPDFLDLDADNDGVPDAVEVGAADSDGDGFVDVFTDVNGNGLHDELDGNCAIIALTTVADTAGSSGSFIFSEDNTYDGSTASATGYTTNGSAIDFDIGLTLPAGATISIVASINSAGTGTFSVTESTDDVTYSGSGSVSVTTVNPSFQTVTHTLQSAARYVRITRTNSSSQIPIIHEVDYSSDPCSGVTGTFIGTKDSDNDGHDDYNDIDADNDGIADVIESGGIDANGDGRYDGSADTDNDGYFDAIDGDVGNDGTAENTANAILVTGADTDNNGLPNSYPNDDQDGDNHYNFQDIDADNDGIVDNFEGQTTAAYVAPSGTDTDGDGLDNSYDSDNGGIPITNPTDTDSDANDEGSGGTLADYLDGDSDNDGVVDIIEGDDANSNGHADWDSDTDYVAAGPTGASYNLTEFTEEAGATADADGDGLLDIFDTVTNSGPNATTNITGSNADRQNTDGLDDRDWRDTDDDNDGIVTGTAAGAANGSGTGEDYGNDANWQNDQNDNAPTPDYLNFIDNDKDGIADASDLDSDNDGILDTDEDGGTGIDPSADADGDGVPNYKDSNLAGFTDTNGNGVDDRFDPDGDGIPSFLDLDSDNDGITDAIENGGADANGDGTIDGFADADADGIPDTADVDVIGGGDTDGDGISDTADVDQTSGTDADGDGIDDSFDPDTDGDGLLDQIDSNNGGTALPTVDSDGDGVDDPYDLDADNDGIPDVIEAGGEDTDGDGILDDMEDSDNDGIPDSVDHDIQGGTDTDGDDIPDAVDPDQTAGTDTDGDGILDAGDPDADGDGYYDNVDPLNNGTGAASGKTAIAVTGADTDANGTPNSLPTGTSGIDTDSDGFADWVDRDADNDGITDVAEAGGVDANGDGVIDAVGDSNNNGLLDLVDANNSGTALVTTGNDTDNDGKPNSISSGASGIDRDGDGLEDWIDLDSDNDGIADIIEAGGVDANGDGQVDTTTDADNDGYADVYDAGGVGGTPIVLTGTDSDADGKPNSIPAANDTDGDTFVDWLDIDADNDGIVDNIEAQTTAAYVAPSGNDTDSDGIDDSYDNDNLGTAISPTDTDGNANDDGSGNALADYIDGDSDDDGVVDIIEGHDNNSNGFPDWDTDTDYPATTPTQAAFVTGGFTDETGAAADADSDGLLDIFDNVSGITTAGNVTGSNAPTQNTDAMDDDDWRDTDDDNDGRLTNAEDRGNGGGVTGSETPVGGADGNWANDFTQTGSSGVGNTPDYLYEGLLDSDDDGVADVTDLDADNDGILDTEEDGGTGVDPSADADNDGIPNYKDSDLAGYTDSNGDGVDDRFDNDNDGIPDFLDLDADNDGIPDVVEVGGADADGNGRLDDWADADDDGIPDTADVDVIGGGDTDGDGISDTADNDQTGGTDTDGDGIDDGFDPDTDGDGVLNDVDGGANSSLTSSGIRDTDGDGIDDHLDLDTDNDGIPDVVEAGGTDTNGDGIADTAGAGMTDVDTDGWLDRVDGDVFSGSDGTALAITGADTDNDGLPNSVPNAIDKDGDGVEDWEDLDADNDGIPDVIEAGGEDTNGDGLLDATTDTDSDGFVDEVDGDVGNDATAENTAQALALTGTDTDNNGQPNSTPSAIDSDGDSYADWLDLDADGDAIPDVIEAGGTDTNGDGLLDTFADADGDGYHNDADPTSGQTSASAASGETPLVVTGADTGSDSKPDSTPSANDTDGDGVPDWLDVDADNDGITDVIESGGTDADGDGVHDASTDTDGDGLIDDADPTNGATASSPASGETALVVTGADSNSDGEPNSTPAANDTDGDAIADWLDIDADNDGIVDAIEGGMADNDGDGEVDGFVDVDNDGLNDLLDPDIVTGTSVVRSGTDSDSDGAPNSVPAANDTDGDGHPDWLDRDADNDGIADVVEAGGIDTNGDGIIDGAGVGMTDTDGDGLLDLVDGNNSGTALVTTGTDTDSDGIPNSFATTYDTDQDNLYDWIDLDADADGIADVLEAYGTAADGDSDGVLGTGAPTDTDNDGFNDSVDSDNSGTATVLTGADGDSDGRPNSVPAANDTDGDGFQDWIDIDADNDGIVDNFEGQTTAAYVAPAGIDTDGDGLDNSYDPDNGGAYIIPTDTDSNANDDGSGNALADYVDGDSDDDGVVDMIEGHDNNTNGIPDWDTDNDYPATTPTQASYATGGFTDETGSAADTDGDGLLDIFDTVNGAATAGNVTGSNAARQNTDGTDDRDWRDTDDDNDGRLTSAEDRGDGTGVTGSETPGGSADGNWANDFTQAANAGSTPDYLYQGTIDSDGDGVNDVTDLDSDNDGIIDTNEAGGTGLNPSTDTDNDGIPNYRDADEPTMSALTDSNSDGVYDEFDHDLDGIPDFLDLDSDNDGITDVAEVGGADSDGNGIIDNFTDGVDSDGLHDHVDLGTTSSLVPSDTDGDGVNDVLDLDSDNDGITDVIESGGADNDGDGILDNYSDADNDGYNDSVDPLNASGTPNVTTGTDTDSDGIPNSIPTAIDQDGDGVVNWLDLDSDNDGISDVTEAGGTDVNNDGILDGFTDSDSDGYNDTADADVTGGTNGTPIVTTNTNTDANNGTPNGTNAIAIDWDQDGVYNWLDLDSDNDGITDVVESSLSTTLDANNDGIVDGADSDSDGIKDAVDSSSGNAFTLNTDTDGDTIANSCDLDSDNDGIGDLTEGVGPTGSTPANTNGIVNGSDSDGDGLLDLVDATPIVPNDQDGDGVFDMFDLDTDNDGLADVIEGGGTDSNNDGIIDGVDSDGDGLRDAVDTDSGNSLLSPPNSDGDAVVLGDWRDLDSDGDGISDTIESGGTDADEDGRVDGSDSDGDGIKDIVDSSSGNAFLSPSDFDGDGVPNYRDQDSDNDGITDNVEMQLTGASYVAPSGTDSDSDGIDNAYDEDIATGNYVDPLNFEGTGNDDYLDLDADDDTEPDYYEGFDDDMDEASRDDILARVSAWETANGNPGLFDATDTDADGIYDFMEIGPTGRLNYLEPTSSYYQDTDSDGLIDLFDTDHNGVAASTTDFDVDGLPDFRDTPTPIPLPVELLSFNASSEELQVVLNWETASEDGASHFEIERSVNGNLFQKIGRVEAKGNSNRIQTYQFEDLEPMVGVSYYRLKMVDLDNSYEYSKVEAVQREGSVELGNYVLAPNPVVSGETWYIQNALGLGRVQTVSIHTLDGRLLAVYNKPDLDVFGNRLRFPGDAWSTGTYLVKIIEANGQNSVLKLLIK